MSIESDLTTVNDLHSRLNESRVRLVEVEHLGDIVAAVQEAASAGLPIAVSGGRHAMGGQQFCDGGLLLDMRGCRRVIDLDVESGLVTVEAGIMWPELVARLGELQGGDPHGWGIRQKQTGADALTIGGTVSANGHGRGLTMRPIVDDVEELTLVDADGRVRTCSRTEDAELFSLVVGGYGLLGVIHTVTLRLVRRHQVERVVEVRELSTVTAGFAERIADGYLYGDFQFSVDEAADDFLGRGVFSCYRPTAEQPVSADQKVLTREEWGVLLHLAHTDRARVVQAYIEHYLATSGQVYSSDTHQMAEYVDGYHAILDAALGAEVAGSEMITELYVPRDRLEDFMHAAATHLRESGAMVVYGTVRLIEADTETVLAWARESWACVIFNLHVEHSAEGVERAADDFRALIDLALERSGSFFLTYHRWATRAQLEAGHPRLAEFLRAKLEHDPQERFQSDWYRHTRSVMGL